MPATAGKSAICGPSTATDAPRLMPVHSSKVFPCPTPAPSATAEAVPGAFAPHWTTLCYLQAEIILLVVAVPPMGPRAAAQRPLQAARYARHRFGVRRLPPRPLHRRKALEQHLAAALVLSLLSRPSAI